MARGRIVGMTDADTEDEADIGNSHLLPRLFDVHTHHPAKTADGAEHKFVASGFSSESNEEVIAYSRAHGCLFSLGLGPQEIQREDRYPDIEEGIGAVEKQAERAMADATLRARLVAIGEVGLDKHWGKTTEERERQFYAFERMMRLAGKLDLPLIVHSRDAESECIRLLLAAKFPRVIMHCFGGKLEQAKQVADAGWLISIPPQPNSERKKIIKELPLTSLVIESDAPYIGKRSEDALESARMIARYRGIEVEKALEMTRENAKRIFGLKD